ncbi:hypothetical protein DCAR_0934419 [Daucus carota subsp. sativus]|uniref:NAD(P)H-quinone oxidoreductase subunit S, chloroplastic n=1 Tax=Daucus carota subsp. sativus TaxID=79200 RepID=A0AAF0XV50_DAUCS|nr:PREDICTED: NAD(P)H-quinone oxidoreductase subunit S, chloroplastic [Daucus carota subsp. sativus]WOH14891.1 hypothetical protein DCAR_0934419 [Daucus carota subsp. sativus]
MASFNLCSLEKSTFLGRTNLLNHANKPFFSAQRLRSNKSLNTTAKLSISEIFGGRGLCNGEEGLQQELKKTISQETSPSNLKYEEESRIADIPEDGFDKELLGLTGGFPGGEKGLQEFIAKNPPPKKPSPSQKLVESNQKSLTKKSKPPVLPLLMPGMIAIVKNPNNPYYMYCGIVQRITDGMAGVLFEGGNWDRLITFKLDELERREKGPPMVSCRSVILETMVEQDAK